MNETPMPEPSKYNCDCGNLADWFAMALNAYDNVSVAAVASCPDHLDRHLRWLIAQAPGTRIVIRRENENRDFPPQ